MRSQQALQRFCTLLVLLIPALAGPVALADYEPFSVHVTDDPQTNVMGWSHAFTVRDPGTGDQVFMPLMGHNHSPATDNSVRVYHPLEDRWEYWQQDLHGQLSAEEWFAGGETDPLSASGRNNYIGFYLPWEGEAGQLWIAAPGGSLAANHGIYDIAEKRWVRLVGNDSTPEFAPIRYRNETAYRLVDGWNYADVVCEESRTLVRYGGKNQGNLVVVEPDEDGDGYVASGYSNQPPGPRNNVRNAAICVDGQMYLFGGTREWKGEATTEVWRLDVAAREWHREPPTGHPVGPAAVVTYDPDRNAAAILFSDGTNRYATYRLGDGTYLDLTDTLGLPASLRAAGAFVPGVGHLYRGGEWGGGGWTTHRRVYCVSLAPAQSCGQ